MMLRGENSRDVVARVEAKVAEINGSNLLPAGLRIEPFYERSDIIVKSIEHRHRGPGDRLGPGRSSSSSSSCGASAGP